MSAAAIEDVGAYARLRPVVPGARFFSKCCTRCNEVKPLEAFWRNKRGSLGRRADCIACAKAGARRGVDPSTIRYETPETLALMREKFALNERGEVVYRSDAPKAGRKAGEVAGWLTPTGYRVVDVTLASGRPRNFQAHRIAFALANGRWPAPDAQIDHVDHATSTTDPARLREVSAQVNRHNQFTPSAANTSGIRGVRWHRQTGKWAAAIKVDGKSRHIGLFDDKVEAGLAYAAAKLQQQTAVPIVTCARIALDAMGVDHAGLDRPHVLGAFLRAYKRHRAPI